MHLSLTAAPAEKRITWQLAQVTVTLLTVSHQLMLLPVVQHARFLVQNRRHPSHTSLKQAV